MQLHDDESVKLPIGDWYDQAIDWCDNELKWLFDAVEWPFDQAMELMNNSQDQFFSIPRLAAIVVLGLVAYLGGGLRRTSYVVGALAILALMGDQTWQQSMVMLYSLLVVLLAAALCTTLAIASLMRFARDNDGDISLPSLQRTLTGVSWLHPFGLMLPAVFFFGIGQTASMVLAAFTAVPIAIMVSISTQAPRGDQFVSELGLRVRTGIRASAIPTLILLGILAIMGMGGIGQFLFRSLSNQDPALSGHAMAAMWLIALVAWSLLGPWSFSHLPGYQARAQRRAVDNATREEVAEEAGPMDISVPV